MPTLWKSLFKLTELQKVWEYTEFLWNKKRERRKELITLESK